MIKPNGEIKISVIIPAYNVENYIKECIESVTDQTLKEIEVFCVEDVSTDHTAEIIEDLSKRDERIHFIKHSKNMGFQTGRNEGLEKARGKYIYYLDSDDYLKRKDALELIYNRMESDKLDALCFETETVDELVTFNDKKRFDGHKRSDYPKVMSGPDSFVLMNKTGEYKSPVWLYAYSREFLISAGIRFIPNSFSEDLIYTFHVHLLAKRVGVMSEELHCYRLRDNSQVHSDRRVYKTKGLERNIWYLFKLMDIINERGSKEDQILDAEILAEIRAWKRRFDACTYEEKKEYISSIQSGIIFSVFVDKVLSELPYILPPEKIDLLRSKKVFFYGAGEYARKYKRLFEINDIDIEGIIVSKKNTDKFGGFDIIEFEKWNFDNDSILVPAVSDKYKTKIMQQIKNMHKDASVFDVEEYNIFARK